MNDSPGYTPIIRQYSALKEQYKGCLLFYRLGDFYELFLDDAVEASRVLDIVLTKRGAGVPMCGVPYHSSGSYLSKLVKLGYKVAICEQLETAEEARRRGHKSLVRRDVVRIVTPGTLLEDELLEARESNYLACLSAIGDRCGIAWLEFSTGLFSVRTSSIEDVDSEIQRIRPRELLLLERLKEVKEVEIMLKRQEFSVTSHSDSFFDVKRAEKVICEVYKVGTLKGLGNFQAVEISACGALLEYVKMTQRDRLPELDYPRLHSDKSFMLIDGTAIRNLELFYTQSGERRGSLVSVIDRTATFLGSRLLKRYLSFPSACYYVISKRQDAVEFFLKNQALCKSVRRTIFGIADIERILTRVKLGRCSPRDVYDLSQALGKATDLVRILGVTDDALTTKLLKELGDHSGVLKLMRETLLENSVVNPKEGGFINPNCNARLMEVLRIESDSGELIRVLRDKYQGLTGISSLKIASNNILGHYVEVPSSYSIKDQSFIHRQSLAGSVRYTTVELKELEERITTARKEIVDLEVAIFNELCSRVAEVAQDINLTASAIAELDVLTSFAELAVERNYTRPVVDDSSEFFIKKGRHPVVENGTHFIANCTNLSREQRLCLITGPNMAGKSTFLRQNALIAILAHMGSFVPAEHAHIGIVDKVFSRVGASDNIAMGYSTFMVEMTETAAILNQATDKSLVVLDEVGRGTGIRDGLSIALAVIEHIHDVTKSRAICATHYHELPRFSGHLKHMRCFCMRIEEWEGEVVFLHEVVPGYTDKSYGIHIAKLAGFPSSTIGRAKFFMDRLSSDRELDTDYADS